jgi:hypothetical protein
VEKSRTEIGQRRFEEYFHLQLQCGIFYFVTGDLLMFITVVVSFCRILAILAYS